MPSWEVTLVRIQICPRDTSACVPIPALAEPLTHYRCVPYNVTSDPRAHSVAKEIGTEGTGLRHPLVLALFPSPRRRCLTDAGKWSPGGLTRVSAKITP